MGTNNKSLNERTRSRTDMLTKIGGCLIANEVHDMKLTLFSNLSIIIRIHGYFR